MRAGRPLHSLEVELSRSRSPARATRPDGRLAQEARRSTAPRNARCSASVRIVGGAPAVSVLQQGDLVLAIDGQVVSRFREVERAVADKPQVEVTVWRGQASGRSTCRPSQLPGADVDRLVQWAGATLQAPHRAMSAQRGIPPDGVYVGYFAYGSPATRYGLYPGRRIIEVDGVPTPDLDAFLRAVTGRPDRSSLRLQDDHLEQRAGSDHSEARQALLAGLRVAPHHRGLGAPRRWSERRDTAVDVHGAVAVL